MVNVPFASYSQKVCKSQPSLGNVTGTIYALKVGRSRAVDLAQQENAQDKHKAGSSDFLCCAKCQYRITRAVDRTVINEKHHHVFANPHGYIFQIGCFARAPGCVTLGEETDHFTWFPGYTWQIALCGQCLTLLGWVFRSRESQFFGLILDNLAASS